ncbi:MAG: diguanylate cyclase [Elusimicrobiales bacterium]|nr:diguanylate cyclase [Elusimicrobiales bacterium]
METQNAFRLGLKGIPEEDSKNPLNPVTGLYGSSAAERQVKFYLENSIPFALCCLDLDNFHAYNSRYGYDKGDEILRYAAEVIKSAAGKMTDGNYFVAHLGGDDFIFVTTPDKCEALSQTIANTFDKGIAPFYDDDARVSGFISIPDRRNRKCFYPLLSVTISITTPDSKKHYGEIMKSVMELKKYGKKIAPRNGGSIFVRDRRL